MKSSDLIAKLADIVTASGNDLDVLAEDEANAGYVFEVTNVIWDPEVNAIVIGMQPTE